MKNFLFNVSSNRTLKEDIHLIKIFCTKIVFYTEHKDLYK